MELIHISAVVPVFQEEEIIEDFYAELSSVMKDTGMRYEIIFVNDDYPNSKTMRKLRIIHDRDPNVVIIGLARNFGHQEALTAGIDFARGDVVVMLDADLQHPPRLIFDLLAQWRKGFDIVYTKRGDAVGETLFKKITSKLFYVIMNKVSDIDMDFNCADFRLMNRKTIDKLKKIREKNRFLRGIISWMGFKTMGIEYVAPARPKGESKYTFVKMLKLATNGILSFSNFPIRFISIFGIISSTVSLLYLIRVCYFVAFTDEAIPDLLPIASVILFVLTVLIIMVGVVGEYIAMIFTETKNRPIYLLDKVFDKFEGKGGLSDAG